MIGRRGGRLEEREEFMHYVAESDVTLGHRAALLVLARRYITGRCRLGTTTSQPTTADTCDVYNSVLHNITDASPRMSCFYLLVHFRGPPV